jgi:outer membrane protein assembly factor BamA
MTRPWTVSSACAVLVLGAANSAVAQETRTALLEQQRAERAKIVRPYEPGKLEKGMLWFERTEPIRKLSPFNGFFVQYDYTYKPIGSGIAFSTGYRRDLFDRRARAVLEAGISFRNYQLLRGDFSMPYLADEKFELGVEGTYRHQPQDDFYGLGFDSEELNRTNYRLDLKTFMARAVATPTPWLRFGTRIGRIDTGVGPGTDSRFPSIEEVFGPAEAPGLQVQPDYTVGDVFATVDTRDQPGNARSGGLYSLTWRHYADEGSTRFGFRETNLELVQFFPIFDKKRVFAVRGHVIGTASDDGSAVPFYFQPTLGGSTSLRSYRDYRFRAPYVFYINAEYRWEAFSGLDMALFSDWGKVADSLSDLELAGMRNAYGIGFRFNTYKTVFLRIDVASGGGEGVRLHLKYSRPF